MTGWSARCPPRTSSVADHIFDDDIEVALRELKPEFRAAVVLCDVEGLSYEEISDVLGVKIGTVRSRIHRGRSLLRAALQHRAPTPTRHRYEEVRWTEALRRRPRPWKSPPPQGLSALIDGELSPRARERAVTHARNCAQCRREIAETLEVKQRVTKLAPVEVSVDLRDLVASPRAPGVAAPVESRPTLLRKVFVAVPARCPRW